MSTGSIWHFRCTPTSHTADHCCNNILNQMQLDVNHSLFFGAHIMMNIEMKIICSQPLTFSLYLKPLPDAERKGRLNNSSLLILRLTGGPFTPSSLSFHQSIIRLSISVSFPFSHLFTSFPKQPERLSDSFMAPKTRLSVGKCALRKEIVHVWCTTGPGRLVGEHT